MARLWEFLVPGVGIEPTTQGSSGLRSTTELSRLDVSYYPSLSIYGVRNSVSLNVLIQYVSALLVSSL